MGRFFYVRQNDLRTELVHCNESRASFCVIQN